MLETSEPRPLPVPPGPGPPPHWSSLHPPGKETSEALLFPVQAPVKIAIVVSKNEWHADTWYNPVELGVKLNQTAR